MAPGPLTSGQQELIIRFADGLLPLTDWIRTAGKYTPPGETPWRTAGTLSAVDIGFPAFFQQLLDGSNPDRDLAKRWLWIAEDPLRANPLADPKGWRAARGLDSQPAFGAIASGNILIADASGQQVSRADFYEPFWPLLSTALTAANADAANSGSALDWPTFGLDLLNDRSKYWPQGGKLKSSVWCKQFVKDLLYCALGMQNPAPAPWKFAVLAELGENRRVGNAYTPAQVAIWVEALKTMLEKPKVAPLEEREIAYMLPVGAPPVESVEV